MIVVVPASLSSIDSTDAPKCFASDRHLVMASGLSLVTLYGFPSMSLDASVIVTATFINRARRRKRAIPFWFRQAFENPLLATTPQ
jgi:hypothetical protein